jgi:hypothetical protein
LEAFCPEVTTLLSITVQAADGPKENDILLKHAALTPWVAAVIEGLSVLMDSNLTFDYVGILPGHLAHVPILAERLPALRIRGGYGKVWREINVATSQLGPQERARIFGGTAIEVYRLVL